MARMSRAGETRFNAACIMTVPTNGSFEADDNQVCEEDSYERFRPYLRLLASSRMPLAFRRRLDASDIVQQTLMEAHRCRDQCRGTQDAELAGWLRQMLLHNLVDALRAATYQMRDVHLEQPLDAMDHSGCRAESWLASEQTSPSQHVMRDEQLLEMSLAIADLPDDQQLAIVLHHLQGCKLKEVAEHLGRSETAAAGLISRGMKTLRRRMKA